jgi:hypothetical protein
MKRAILFFILSVQTLFAGEPWPAVPFTEVRAYAWPADKNSSAVILDDMKLMAGVINKEGALLTENQTKQLIAAVTGKHPEYPVARCHTPHNAFVFYDAAKRPVAYVEICFDCFNHRISPAGSSKHIDLTAQASIFEAHKLPMGKFRTAADFVKTFEGTNRLTNENNKDR